MKRVTGKIATCLTLLSVMFAAGACQKQVRDDVSLSNPTTDVTLDFKAVVDAAPLEFDKTYNNFFQEAYTVKTFKYYVSGIEFINTDSNRVSKVAENSYFLIDEASSATSSITLKVPARTFNQVAFIIGVDSLRNVSGAQTGALDPVNGMFWTWNSGYIMAKLEGTSPLSTEPGNRIQYHIGGFRQADNVLKKIVLTFPGNIPQKFSAGSSSSITITADVNSWFHDPYDLHIAQLPVSMTPGDLSQKIAANYSKMFSLVNIVNN